jgi:hypothetical protein
MRAAVQGRETTATPTDGHYGGTGEREFIIAVHDGRHVPIWH